MLEPWEQHLEPLEFKKKYFKSVEIVEKQFKYYQWPLYVVFVILSLVCLWVWLSLELKFVYQAPWAVGLLIQLIAVTAIVALSAFVASRFDQQAYNIRDNKLVKHHVRCYKYRGQHPDILEHFAWWVYADSCRREYNYIIGFDDDLPDWVT